MKIFTCISILAIVAITTTFAQPTLQWDKRFNGPASANDKGNAVAVDASGNIYVTGSSAGGGTVIDYLTIKYKSDGTALWSKTYNSTANGIDVALAIKVDGAKNVYITGKSQGSGDAYNIVTIKYDSLGNQLWASVFNESATSAAIGTYNLVVDGLGNVYVIGAELNGGVLIKYNPSGIVQWSLSLGNYAYLLDINNLGNIVVVKNDGGNTDNYIIWEINPSNGNIIYIYNDGCNGFVTFRGKPNKMVLLGNGNVYILSTIASQARIYITVFAHGIVNCASNFRYFSPSAGGVLSGVDLKIDANLNVYALIDHLYSVNHYYLTFKFDPALLPKWSNYYNTTLGIDDIPVSLSLSNNLNNPNIIVSGITPSGNGNITTIGYDNDGNQLWNPVVYDCGNNGIDYASAMVMDNCDNIYITGYSNCSGTNQDVKTIKYSALTSIITANGPTIFCPGGSVTLTASQANSYLWSNGSTTPSITVSAAGIYSVTITNASGCVAASSATSVTVNPMLTPSINIGVSSTSICSGDNVTFMATPTNGGTAPTYQWFVNNSPAGTSPTFSTTTLLNGAQVYCAMTSNATCASPLTATSNTISITVNPVLTASVSVTGPTTICAGDNATFTTMATNGGTASTYQWFVNNMQVGTGPTYSTISLSNGTQVYCAMNSNAACASPPTATSNTITVTVNPVLPPSLSIVGPAVLCLGQNTTFTTMPTKGGAMPTYQWVVNNNPVGTGPSYSSSMLANGDQIYCTMTSNAACVSTTTATSPTTTVTVLALPNVQVTPNGPTTFCQEKSVILTANPTGSYLWSTGETMKSITVSTAGDYKVTVTATNTCSAVSAPVTVTTIPLPQAPTIFPTGPVMLHQEDSITLTASFASSWLWNTGDTTQSITVSDLGNYSVVVTDINGCSASSDTTSIIVGTSEAMLPENFRISPNPSNGSFTVKFFLPEAKMVAQRVLNVLGQVVWASAPRLETGDYHSEIDLGNAVVPGIYLLETRLDGRAFLRKIEVR